MLNSNPTTRETSNQKEKIRSLISNEIVKQKVLSKLQLEKITYPALKLELVLLDFQIFKIEESDILKIFQCFGEIISITVNNNTAIIIFQELVSAYFALQILNEKELPELNAILHLSWHDSIKTIREPLKEIEKNSSDSTNSSKNRCETCGEDIKYTCRFNINIENDKKFKVVRKLIGTNGYKMKKIIEKCCKSPKRTMKNIVKLRLRGKGSGFKEGPDNEESKDPLHLWVSTKDRCIYLVALSEIENLLTKIYAEFDKFWINRGKPAPCLKIEKFEKTMGNQVQISEKIWKELETCQILNEEEIEDLINVRNEARRRNDFQEADRIRELFKQKGILLVDEKGMKGKGCEVTTWKFI